MSSTDNRLLWIDDEIQPDDPTVQLLSFEGFRVDCVRSGHAGIGAALRNHYEAALIDLHLPDTTGAFVLDALVQAGVRTPVVVLSGYANHENVVAAFKLGAVDFLAKPVWVDEIITAIRVAVGIGPHAKSRSGVLPAATGTSTSVQSRHGDALLSAAHRLSDDSEPAEFIAHLRTFQARLRRDAAHDLAVTRTATKLLEAISAHLGNGEVPSLSRVAADLNLTVSQLTQQLHQEIGATYSEVRRALRVRRSLADVASSLERIDQIAYKHGYDHAAQFDRDFRYVVGLDPRGFRRLCRKDRS